MAKHRLVYRGYWDKGLAKSISWWELQRQTETMFGRPRWRPVREQQPTMPGEMSRVIVTGDHEWAKRTAKHYGLEIPYS